MLNDPLKILGFYIFLTTYYLTRSVFPYSNAIISIELLYTHIWSNDLSLHSVRVLIRIAINLHKNP